jgi:hypothetical protein
MRRAGLHRRLVALVAAYAVALQGLLAAVAAVSPARALEAVLCTAQAGEHPGQQGGHAPPRPDCTLCPLACASAVAPPASAARVVLIVALGDPMPAPRAERPAARAMLRAGLARAPPL